MMDGPMDGVVGVVRVQIFLEGEEVGTSGCRAGEKELNGQGWQVAVGRGR